MSKTFKGFLDQASKVVKKGVKEAKTYASPEAAMKRKQIQLERLRIENKIAVERKKLEKNKPANPFGDMQF